MISSEVVEYVDYFTYLESPISIDGFNKLSMMTVKNTGYFQVTTVWS